MHPCSSEVKKPSPPALFHASQPDPFDVLSVASSFHFNHARARLFATRLTVRLTRARSIRLKIPIVLPATGSCDGHLLLPFGPYPGTFHLPLRTGIDRHSPVVAIPADSSGVSFGNSSMISAALMPVSLADSCPPVQEDC